MLGATAERLAPQAAATVWVDFHPESAALSADGAAGFCWPVGLVETRAARDAFAEALVELIRQADPERDPAAMNLWLAAPNLIVECVESFTAQALVTRLAAQGLKPCWGAEGGKWRALAEGQSPTPSLSTQRLTRGYAPTSSWRRALRPFNGLVAGDGLSRRPMMLANRARDAFTFSASPLLHATASATGRRVILARLGDWLPADEIAPGEAKADPLAMAAIEAMDASFAAQGAPLEAPLRRYLETTFATLSGVAGAYLAAARKRASKAPRRFWVGTLGHLGARAISRAVVEAGGTTTVFDHGTGCGWWRLPIRSLIEMDLADEMITFTPAHAAGTEANIEPRFLVRPERVASVHAVANAALSAAPAQAAPQRSRSGRRPVVMYVATLFNGEKAEFEPLPSDATLVDWQARLIARLVDWGYDVILKPHPESIAPPPAALTARPEVSVRLDPFEQVEAEADALLFDWPQSTAFRNATKGRLPIVYVDFDQVAIAEAAAPDLDARVARVAGVADASNRLQVSWDALRAAFAEADARAGDPRFGARFYGG